MTQQLMDSIIHVLIAGVGVIVAVAFAMCVVMVWATITIAKSVAQGRSLRVAFALDDLTRAATIEALKQDPGFIEAIANYLGDSIKGEKGDPADPAEVAFQITSDPHALSILKNGVVTHATAEVAKEARQLLTGLENEINRQLVQPYGELAEQRELLQSYVTELDGVKQLLARAQTIMEQAQSETAEMRATAAKLNELIATSELLKRLLGPPAS